MIVKRIRFAGVLIILAAAFSCSEPPKGQITGVVVIPEKVEPEKASEHENVFLYVRDYTGIEEGQREFQEGPVVAVRKYPVNQLEGRELTFAFSGLEPGIYQVSCLIDIGRPHVSPGSQAFIAYPGDFSGWTQPNIRLDAGETEKVKIDYGMYVAIPKGYESPLYLE